MEPESARGVGLLMDEFDKVWLIANMRSGSSSPEVIEQLRAELTSQGMAIAGETLVPDDELPSPSDLDRAGVSLAIVHTGDGTLNAAISRLAGWDGAVLVLPGGTMNLLSKRLHGEAGSAEILAALAGGGALAVRPQVICCEAGLALAGLLAGPGARWSSVREAMREVDLAAMAGAVADAVTQSAEGARTIVCEPELGRREGYPLLDITPCEYGMALLGYRAGNGGEFAAQGWALLRRRFREGPHDRLGLTMQATLKSADGTPLEVLLDGEAAECGASLQIELAPCPVDLLATGANG